MKLKVILICWLVSLVSSRATVYYIGGENPVTGTWMEGTWSNFVYCINNLSPGDELRIADSIVRTSDFGTEHVTNSVSNTSITGGWNGKDRLMPSGEQT